MTTEADWLSGSGNSTDCSAKTGSARMRADGRSRRGQRFRTAPDYQPDRGKNRRRATLRRGVHASRRRFRCGGPAAPLRPCAEREVAGPLVPASIQDSLMERLDRLGTAKRVAQIASVFGRQFDYEGISNVLPGRGESLKHSLQALESAGIVYRIEEPQDTVFAFKHAMIQEVAYSSLAQGGKARTPCARRVVAASGERRSERAASRPCWAITMRAPATFRKRSRPGFRRANPRSADQPPRRPWPIFARASR